MDLPGQLHRIPLAFGQCYLWRDGDRATLIDTGPVGSGEAIAAALVGLGLDRSAVVRIVLTHYHTDHIGSAAEIRGWAGAEVVAHVGDSPVVRGDEPEPEFDLMPLEAQLRASLGGDALAAAPPCPVDREVVHGDLLDFGGGARVVHGPGHTPGSIALHLPGSRVLFTGDTVAENDGMVLLGPFNLDRATAAESFRMLTAMDVDLALVGHGEPVSGAELRRAEPGPFAG